MRQAIINFAKRSLKRITNPVKASNPWSSAQKYELGNSISYMQHTQFKLALDQANSSEFYTSSGYVDQTLLKEFFSNNLVDWKNFMTHISGKRVMEIGPCLIAEISRWDLASERIAVEPLYNEISEYQNKVFGKNGFPNVSVYSSPAEVLIPELVSTIDGALFVRNCVDHSPNWPFILGNISRYLASGGYLLIWNDLLHPESYKEGHYDICDNKEMFRDLIISFGFQIISEWEFPDSPCLNYGCRAIKI